jgi:hypothetical protein
MMPVAVSGGRGKKEVQILGLVLIIMGMNCVLSKYTQKYSISFE